MGANITNINRSETMRLKKLALAACVAPYFLPLAQAQARVQIYGKLYPYLVTESGSGAKPVGSPVSTLSAPAAGVNNLDTTNGIASGNSRIGIRGARNVNHDLKASFQLEGVVGVDNGNNDGNNFNFNRDNYVGLEGGFGAVRYGNLETSFKNYGDTLSFLGVSSGTFMSSSNILRRPGFGTSNASRFHERRANSVQYESPTWGGVQFGLQYATEEQKNNAAQRQKTVSMGVKYDKGPIYLSLSHEIHYDYFGGTSNIPTALRNSTTTTDSNDYATQFSAEYRINKQHKLGFDAIRKSYNETGNVTGRFDTYQNMAYQLAFENRWTDKIRTAGGIVRSNAGTCTLKGGVACSTTGLEGTKYTLGIGYDLDKDTRLFAAASLLKQGDSASYGVREFSNRPNVGENIRHMAVGMAYSF